MALLLTVTSTCAAQEPGRVVSPRQKVDAGKGSGKKVAQKTSGEAVPLNENGTVLLDRAGGRLLVKSEVVLRQGALEMLACRKKTKEHESILSIDAEAFVIHSGLLALKATPGGPAEYEPAYKPPRGQKIAIFLNWTDKGGQSRREPAQSWVRESVNRFWLVKLEKLPAGVVLPENSELKYDSKQRELLWYGPMTEQQKKEFLGLSDEAEYRKAIEYFFERSQLRGLKSDWVFVGSGFYEDEATGQKQYLAEEGQVICVSNFQTAMIDVAAQSSDQADALLYEAWTDRIPAKGTQVMLELVPVFEKPTEN
ncbi:MAG: hypothetical protein EHM42_10425 [Planctomycetaceae bacterium]|nr:MAG: hypothetical protein EHM42_10425 [Planctomycetaceae bacterium]